MISPSVAREPQIIGGWFDPNTDRDALGMVYHWIHLESTRIVIAWIHPGREEFHLSLWIPSAFPIALNV